MKRSTARWTTALAATTLLALPSGAWAQTPPAQTPATSTSQEAQAISPQDHLKLAEAALKGMSDTAVTGRAKMRMTELKQHLNALQRAAAANDNTSTAGEARKSSTATKNARGNEAWATEAAAIDRIITELVGPGTTSAATEPGATGTSGTTSAAPALDDETRAKLMEVRAHVTAFAASMSGAASAASAAPASAAQPTTPTEPPTSATQPPTSASQPATSGTSTTQPPTGTEPQTAAAQPPASGAAPQVDEEAAKRHLSAARDTLSQMTQLPAAAQLSGEARTQVSQLISNFNELITTSSNWHDAYAKVDANLTALIGAQTTDESTAAAAAGTSGAVGTAGTATGSLDPTLRAKLVEFRSQLREFEKAAGGASTPAPSAGAAGSASAGVAGGATGAAGSAAAGEQAQTATNQPANSDEALRHIEAIEAILNGNSAGAAGTAGTTGTSTSGTTGTTGAATSSGLMLERAQLEQLRMHLAELRRLLNQK